MKALSYVNTEEMRERYHHCVADKFTVIGLVQGDVLLGYVEYHDDGDNELFIDMIHVSEGHQKKGYSTILLNKLLELHPETLAFTGESTDSAYDYWKAKGALFRPDASIELVGEELESEWDDIDEFEGALHPFSLKINEDSAYVPYWEAS